MKKALSILLTAAMVLSLTPAGNMSVFAAEDITEEIYVGPGENISEVGNLKVEDNWAAAYVSADGSYATYPPEIKDASFTLEGDVSLTNSSDDYNSYAVTVDSYDGFGSADISGNITSKSPAYAYGVSMNAYNNNSVYSSATVGGDIQAEAGKNAVGINATCGKVVGDFKKNITAKAPVAQGIVLTEGQINVGGNVSADSKDYETSEGKNYYDGTTTGTEITAYGKANVDIKGQVSAVGDENVIGVSLKNPERYFIYTPMVQDEPVTEDAPKDEKLSIDIKIGKGILSEMTSDDKYSGAIGLNYYNDKGDINADITGDIVAKSGTANSIGISNMRRMTKVEYAMVRGAEDNGDEAESAKSSIKVHGSVTSDGVGILLTDTYENSENDILIEDTLDAKEIGVGLIKVDNITPNLNLTAWKIKPNERGNVVESTISEPLDAGLIGAYDPEDEEDIVPEIEPEIEPEAEPEIEKAINYIIMTEQPEAGGTFTVTDKDGKALEKVEDFDVAHEGDKILVKPELEDGYEIKAAYNGEDDDKEELSKDDDGNYFIVVPKGGGVNISVELIISAAFEEPTPTPTVEPTPEKTEPQPTKAPETIEEVEKKINKMKSEADFKDAKFGKLKLRVKKNTKKSISYTWEPVEGATQYYIYGNKCWSKLKLKKLTKTTGTSYTLKKLKNGNKVEPGKYYKLLVVATDDYNNVISVSKVAHVSTLGGKLTNYKSIKITKVLDSKKKNIKKGSKITLKAGKKATIKTSTKLVDKDLELHVHRKVSFESSDTAVATVSKSGKIKAVGKGTCEIYAYTQNGLYTTLKVTVK